MTLPELHLPLQLSKISPPPTITVLVPTFNRAHLLGRVFESLKAQSFKDFEWVIVDDGSRDNTAALVKTWQQSSPFVIRYHRKVNGGKHTAINPGIDMARGEFLVMLDSDDWLAPNALERLLELWHAIPEQALYSGVVGLCAHPDGRVIGDRFPQDRLDSNAVDLKYRFEITGDKISLARTDVMREFPFPFQNLAGLVTESLVWNRIAQSYQERYVNEIFAYKEYLEAGLTDRALELQIKAAAATRLFHLELSQVKQNIPYKTRLKAVANYLRFALHAGHGLPETVLDAGGFWAKCRCLALMPLGLMLYLRDAKRFAPQVKMNRAAPLSHLGGD
jgi:glycosyltransferase involved in cell wall biosynthesis